LEGRENVEVLVEVLEVVIDLEVPEVTEAVKHSLADLVGIQGGYWERCGTVVDQNSNQKSEKRGR